MSAPTDSNNPHLPVNHIPGSLNRDQITDLCNYTVLSAVAHELNKVYSGAYTFTELRAAAEGFAARADEIAQGRSWPSIDIDALNPSNVLAASAVPDTPSTATADTSEPGAAGHAPSRPLPATDTPNTSGSDAGEASGHSQSKYAPGSGDTGSATTPEPTPAPAPAPESKPAGNPHPSRSGDLTETEMTQLMPVISA